MPATEPILRRKLFQEVLDRLIDRIRGGDFRPGDQLPSERDLMAFYGVGRPAVREALQALERLGMVTISQGERARVVEPSAEHLIKQVAGGARHLLSAGNENLDHLKDARLFLEEGLAFRAAARATPDDVALLAARLEDHKRTLNDLSEFVAKDMAFHRQIAAMTGNPIFPAIIEAMFDWLGAYYVDIVRVPGAEKLTLNEHTQIFEAIAAGDPERARQAMRAHLTRANKLYRQFEGAG
ncbi:MAG: transcriptional regulator NanR [Geminicoccaceae bacterium]